MRQRNKHLPGCRLPLQASSMKILQTNLSSRSPRNTHTNTLQKPRGKGEIFGNTKPILCADSILHHSTFSLMIVVMADGHESRMASLVSGTTRCRPPTTAPGRVTRANFLTDRSSTELGNVIEGLRNRIPRDEMGSGLILLGSQTT